MADLTPTPERPGLRIAKPNSATPAKADYACRCGESGSTRGDDNARALAAYYADHKNTCGGRK